MNPKNSQAEAPDAVHARMLLHFGGLVRELGGDPALFGEAAGGEPTYRRLIALLERASREVDCADFGMRLALRQDGRAMFGPLGEVMAHSRTFADAIRYVCGHSYAHSLAARIWMADAGDGATFVGHDLLVEGAPAGAQAIEHILLSGNIAAKQLSGGRARAAEVRFRHQPLSPLRLYRRRFGCDVRFGENENGVVYARRAMLAPIVAPDALLYARATRHIERTFRRHAPPFHLQVRGVVTQRLASGRCDAATVARALGVQARTLQRRLFGEQTSFQAVKDEVRRETMLYYLQRTDLSLVAVSAKLGFSEQAVMTRCCRRWFGATPTALRRRSRAGAEARAGA